jgi:DNA polymerase-3 subunit beta
MAQQDVRYFFNGVLVEIENGQLRFVATNGQRLAISVMENVGMEKDLTQFIIPRKGVGELARVVPDNPDINVSLEFSANHMQAKCADAILTTKLIDATYPDYTRAIPKNGDKTLVGDRLEIKEALVRTAILSNEMYRNVRLLLEPGKLEMHSNNPLQEEAEETVSVEYDGPTLEIGFNVSFLIEAFSVMKGDKVQMVLSDANSACLLTDPDDINSRYVISPMML